MTSDGDALRRAVAADPDDDLPRLVYADWLDETGPARPYPESERAAARAALIRTQVELARLEPLSPAARAADEVAAGLLCDFRFAWIEHLRPAVSAGGFARGFVEHVEVDPVLFPAAAAAVFAAEPVRAVRVARPQTGELRVPLEPLFAVPHLRQLTALELPGLGMLQLEYDALARSPHLAGLRSLSLAGNPVPTHWLPDFLAGPHLPALTALDLSDIPNLGPAVTRGLTAATRRSFARLDLTGIVFRSDDLKQALGSRCIRDVEELRLGWAGPAEGPLTLLDLGWVLPWGRLRALDLAGQGLGPEGVREIVRTPAAAGLRSLGLAGNGIGPEGAALLAAAKQLDLYYLDVRRNGLSLRDATALRKRFPNAVVVA